MTHFSYYRPNRTDQVQHILTTLSASQASQPDITRRQEQAGQMVTTEDLEQAIWGDEYIEDPEGLKSVLKGLRRAAG